MPSSRAQRLLGLLNDDILALPKAPSPEPEPPAPVNPGNHQLANNTAQASRAWEGSPEPDSTPVHSSVDQKISALAEALDLDDRASSPSLSESSHEPDPYDDRPSTCLHRGDRAPWGEAYVSIQVASKFPYKFLNRAYSDQVAKKFFDRNQFWNRDWELYYVWPPADLASKPLILISLTQFQLLINEINQYKRNIDFRLADHHRDCGLIIDIDHPEFTPRFLGYSSSREDYNDMESRRVPPIGHRAPGEPTTPAADKPTLEAFKAKIEEAIILNKAKNKAAKAKRKEQRVNSQQNWGRLLKRTQRYFGLRPAKDDKYNPLADPTLNWAELQAAEAARKLPPVDFEKPAPFVFDKNVIFISVDIEAFELDNSKITEVGVATLDVLDIINIPPGKDGTNWHNKIRARHFRIDEHSHLENYRHVAGCAGGFEFGKSEFVRLAEAPQAVASCFKPPFSADLTPAEAEQLWAANASGNSSPSLQGDPSIVNADGKRNLIFVGHDPNQDIKFLQRLGYNPLNLSNLIEVIDTKLLHQHWKRDTQGTSLGKILADLDIIGWKLHNGGNDAVYTLQALVSLGIREASSRGSKELEEQRKHDHQRRMSEAIAEVVAKVSEEADGWSSMEEADDGGAPELAKPAAELEAADSVPPAGHVSPNATDCVFVGNLPYRATPEDVVAFFAKYGTITDVHLPINQATGATKGVGYVSYRTAAEAQNALEKCKNIEFWSRPIRVSMAPPREKKGGRGGNGNSGRNTPIPRNTPVRITDPVQSNPNYKGQSTLAALGTYHARPTAQARRQHSDHGSYSSDASVPHSKRNTQEKLPEDWW